jgi:hypothetical protein
MRKKNLTLATLAAALPLLLLASNANASTQQSGDEHIITTLYAYPTLSSWTQVEDSTPTVTASIADMCAADNTGSGCSGTPWDEQPPSVWTSLISTLQGDGITPLIYIATDYGDESGSTDFSLATVESEVADAVSWYGQNIGFMFDEAATSCDLESSYYGPLYSYVKSVTNDGTVELNAGTAPSSSCYMSAADVLQVFEGSESTFQSTTFPSWMADYSPSQFAVTISAGTSSGVGTDVTDAVGDGIGNVYVDDEAEPPNYSTLPSFWSAEVSDAQAAS